MKAKEGVVLHTGFPQVFTWAVADHVEADQVFHRVVLQRTVKSTLKEEDIKASHTEHQKHQTWNI